MTFDEFKEELTNFVPTMQERHKNNGLHSSFDQLHREYASKIMVDKVQLACFTFALTHYSFFEFMTYVNDENRFEHYVFNQLSEKELMNAWLHADLLKEIK